MNELQIVTQVPGFVFTPTGIIPQDNPPLEQWIPAWEFAQKSEGAVQWWIGDLLNYGNGKYPEEISQYLNGKSYTTYSHYQRICEQVIVSRRRATISFSIHAEVAPFEPEEQERLLDMAEETKATVKQLRKEKHKILLDAKRPTITTDTNLILGDCLQELSKLENDSIDCVITDPPYGIDYQSGHRTATPEFEKIENDRQEAINLLDQSLQIIQSKLKNNSHLYIFTSWKVYPEFKAIIEKYFTINNLLIWEKNNWSMGDLEGNYAEQYEMVIFASKGRRILNGGRDTNILHFDRVSTLNHPTEKPIALLEHLIEKSSNENEVVLDPFMGSGSTCLAAKNKKRKYVGIELDERYYNFAQNRLNG